MILAFHTSAL